MWMSYNETNTEKKITEWHPQVMCIILSEPSVLDFELSNVCLCRAAATSIQVYFLKLRSTQHHESCKAESWKSTAGCTLNFAFILNDSRHKSISLQHMHFVIYVFLIHGLVCRHSNASIYFRVCSAFSSKPTLGAMGALARKRCFGKCLKTGCIDRNAIQKGPWRLRSFVIWKKTCPVLLDLSMDSSMGPAPNVSSMLLSWRLLNKDFLYLSPPCEPRRRMYFRHGQVWSRLWNCRSQVGLLRCLLAENSCLDLVIFNRGAQ